jgi:hypothetical protein
MSPPDPRHPAEADGAYPYELPVHDSAITGTGTGMPGADTRQYEEWHHADPPPRGAGGWDAMQEFGPPPDWTDEGVFIAGDGDRSPDPATSQAGRSASPSRDMDARSARPRRAQGSPAASLRSGLWQQTGSARPSSRTAARGNMP